MCVVTLWGPHINNNTYLTVSMGNYVEYPVLNYSLRYLMGDTSQVLIWISTDTCTLKKKKEEKTMPGPLWLPCLGNIVQSPDVQESTLVDSSQLLRNSEIPQGHLKVGYILNCLVGF